MLLCWIFAFLKKQAKGLSSHAALIPGSCPGSAHGPHPGPALVSTSGLKPASAPGSPPGPQLATKDTSDDDSKQRFTSCAIETKSEHEASIRGQLDAVGAKLHSSSLETFDSPG